MTDLTEADRQALAILAQLDPLERKVWLEMGRRIERGEPAEDAAAWADAEITRLRAMARGATA
jgi:hypothetical protein